MIPLEILIQTPETPHVTSQKCSKDASKTPQRLLISQVFIQTHNVTWGVSDVPKHPKMPKWPPKTSEYTDTRDASSDYPKTLQNRLKDITKALNIPSFHTDPQRRHKWPPKNFNSDTRDASCDFPKILQRRHKDITKTIQRRQSFFYTGKQRRPKNDSSGPYKDARKTPQRHHKDIANNHSSHTDPHKSFFQVGNTVLCL